MLTKFEFNLAIFWVRFKKFDTYEINGTVFRFNWFCGAKDHTHSLKKKNLLFGTLNVNPSYMCIIVLLPVVTFINNYTVH